MTDAMVRVKLPTGIELDVLDTGPRDGEALIFLHGFPESHRTWRHQIAHFSSRYRCIAPDQRGYRGSSAPQSPEMYSPDKLTGDIFQLADALGVDKFTVVGHDWGGAIAWIVAMHGQMNGRVTRAIIANAPHPALFPKLLYTNEAQRAASQYMRDFRDTDNDAVIREHGLLPILMKVVKWDRPTAMDENERDALLKDWSNPDNAIAMLNWYRGSPIAIPPMDAPFELPADYAAPIIPDLAIPALVIWAMDDLALPPANLDGMDDIIKDLTIVKVPGCGHFVPWEAPDQVNQAMDAFLTKS